MASVFIADHPEEKHVQVELKPQSGAIMLVAEDVLEDIKSGEDDFQPYLNDIEYLIQDLLEECFKAKDGSDVKARLQVVSGMLAGLRLRFDS